MGADRKTILPDRFFTFLRQEMGRAFSDGGYCFRVQLCGRLLELWFPSQKQASLIERCMAGKITPADGTPDSVFYFWRDDCTRYIEAEHSTEGIRYIGKTERLVYLPQRRFIGADLVNRNFYCCQHTTDGTEGPIPLWFATSVFDQWAQASELLMLHGAGVGVNGRGVLIAAGSGGGKSTLSVSCLLDGMDFVGDDVLLLSGSGPLQAMPYYTAVKLNPDMRQELNPAMPVFFTREDGKLLLDASTYPFCEKIGIKAIVCPKLVGQTEPAIKRTAPGSVLAELIGSTVQAATIYYSPDFARRAAVRLAGLPVYEIRLSQNLQENTGTLRKLIEGMV